MSGDPRSLRCEHLRDPHSFLTVTFWLLDTLIQYGRIVSVLPPRLREPSRDTRNKLCPFGWSYKIHTLQLYREVRPSPNECPGYDTKQSDDEVPVMLELWRMRSTPSLPLLPVPHWPGIVAPDRALSMGWIELNYIIMLNWIVWIRTVWLNWIALNKNVFDN